MRFFFRSRQFKIIAAIVAAVIVITGTFGIIGRYMSPQASLVGAIVAPFQKVATSVGNFFENADKRWNNGDKLAAENDELKKEYVKKHNIELIEISYKDKKIEKVEAILRKHKII